MNSIIRSILTYAILGPPIGAFIFVLVIIIGPFLIGRGSHQDFVDLPKLLMFGIIFSFVLGGLQAAFAGAAVGFFAEYYNSQKIAVPIVASIIGCLVFLLIAFNGPWSHGLNGPWTSETFAEFLWRMLFFLSFHVLPAICVWLIQRRWSRRQSR